MKTIRNDGKTFCEMDRLFLERKTLDSLLEQVGTPLCVYDEKGLRDGAKSLLSKFAPIDASSVSVPVYLCPRKEVLAVLAKEGVSALCRTRQELRLALESGFSGDRIVYSLLIPDETLCAQLKELDSRLLAANERILNGPLPRRVDILCTKHHPKTALLVPSKKSRAYLGLDRKQVWEYAPKLAEQNISLGIALLDEMNSVELIGQVSKLQQMTKYADELRETTGVEISRFVPGVGPGMQYHRNGPPLDEDMFVREFAKIMQGRSELLCLDMGRRLLDPHAILVTTLLEIIYRNRPSLYVDTPSSVLRQHPTDRFHHSSILGKEWLEGRKMCDVAGPLPMRLDHYADRCVLPVAEIGDRVVFHDVGSSVQPHAPVPTYFHREDGTVVPIKAW